jgi:hypothetical protein
MMLLGATVFKDALLMLRPLPPFSDELAAAAFPVKFWRATRVMAAD